MRFVGAGSCGGRSVSRVAESRAVRPPDRRQGLPWKITVQSGAKRRPKDASVASALDGDLCAARECPARGGRPGQFSRSRSPWVRCCGNCLPAGAGLLTWWRRRAQRAPARQGSACRPPGVGAVPADPVRLWHSSRVSSRYPSVVSRSRVRTGQGRTAWRAEGVPLMTVKKVLTPHGPAWPDWPPSAAASCAQRYAVSGQSKRAQMVRALWSPVMPQSVARAPMMFSPW